MGFWDSWYEKKNKKAKKPKGQKRDKYWWEDQEDYYKQYGGGKYSYDDYGGVTGWDGGGSSHSHSQGSYDRKTNFSSGYTYTYKQPFDMSVSLESRIKSLIHTITGKPKQLLVANGWGVDENNIYYDPNDIASNATDDRVLGQILHQLSMALYYEERKANAVMRREPQYKHLLQALEYNRVDKQLQSFYFGCKYYAESYWEEAGKLGLKPNDQATAWQDKNGDYRPMTDILATHFNYAIHVLSNGGQTFEFTEQSLIDNFKKAVPLIEQYLNEPDFIDALKLYHQIKLLYPIPTPEQQQAMEARSRGSGINSSNKRWAKANASKAKPMDNEREGKGDLGTQGGFSNTKIENPTPEQKQYWEAHAKNLGTINSLHQLLQSIISDNEANKFMRPFKRGKLDKKRIYKYLAVDNRRIFKQRKEINQKKYGMMIMVDQSSSMARQNAQYAMEVTVVLTEVFNRLNLPFAIMGFSDDTFLYKGFNRGVPRETVCSVRKTYGGTNDLGALVEVERQLEKVFQNQRTCVFVITDGEGYDQGAMRTQVEKIEWKNAKVFGIGIGGVDKESLNRSYNKNLVVDNVGGLPRELANLLKGQFRRG